MNPPAGQPRARRPVQKKPVQLNLRRTPTWPEESEAEGAPDSHFWRWFALVFFLHIIAFIVLLMIFHGRPKPPEQFISLLPPGEITKGTPGQTAAPKIAHTTTAPSHQAETPPVLPKPVVPPTPPKPKVQVQPPTPKPPPVLVKDSPTPAPPVKPKPKPPVKPRVKVDLTEVVDAPAVDTPTPKPKIKPKVHPKKPAKPHEDTPESTIDSETQGLSREEVASKLGEKLKASGVAQGQRIGNNGAEHTKASDFADFYLAIHDQVMNKWKNPNLVDETAIDPIVQIHIEKDGRVPADQVKLLRSSNNPAFDQSALEAARSMGYTLQPLPDGCQPDISITFNLRQQ